MEAASAPEDGLDAQSNISVDYSVVPDCSTSAPAEHIVEGGSDDKQDLRLFKCRVVKRRFTHCPEKKISSTFLESYPKRIATSSKPTFKRSRCWGKTLDTIFEYPVITADNKVVIRKRRIGFFLARRTPTNKSVDEVDRLMMNLDIDKGPVVNCPPTEPN